MNKIGRVFVVIGLVVACYLVLLVTMPVLNTLIVSANATMTASSNLTSYPGAVEFMIASPWILWWVPGSIGIAVIVIILRRP